MGKVTIEIASGGLGRQSADTDKWGGIAIDVDALPVGWTEAEVKPIYKVEDLASYGIIETAANNYYKLVYWHVSEVFRLASNAVLYVQLYTVTSSLNDVFTAFFDKEKNLRLLAYVNTVETLDAPAIALVQAEMDLLFTGLMPGGCIVSLKKDVADAIPDFSALAYNTVQTDISNDLTTGGLAKAVFDSALGMCGGAGTFLGQALNLSVHQKQSWKKFPINSGDRWLELGDINGDSVEALTQAQKDTYKTQGVTFMERVPRLINAYISNSRMSTATSDDYAIMTHRRVIDKASVLAYDGIVQRLDGPVYLDPATGKLSAETVTQWQTDAWNAINTNMVIGRSGNAVEVSVDSATGSLPLNAVFINPDQDVLTTEQITVQVRIVPVGAANEIIIDIGLTAII